MVQSDISKKENKRVMTNFLSKYYREILLVVFAIALTFVLIKVFTPAPDKSELLKDKLNQLDKKIEDAEKKQKQPILFLYNILIKNLSLLFCFLSY